MVDLGANSGDGNDGDSSGLEEGEDLEDGEDDGEDRPEIKMDES
jgi:hypothetical protein